MITTNDVSIVGVASAVPKNKIFNMELASLYGKEETEKLISSIGVDSRHVVIDGQTTSDLCYEAAKLLLNDIGWCEKSIDAIIFVSQTGDYQLPATACILQQRLNLQSSTIAFDINLGCSGYVYGLYVASLLVGTNKRVLLLVGDTISKLLKKGDRSTELLFGDAGTATALEFKKGECFNFELGTDGSGAKHIIAKNPINHFQDIRGLDSAYLEMDGGEVFSFTLSRVPKLIKKILSDISIEPESISNCIFHQANRFMIKHLAKKSKFDMNKVPLSIEKYGNTSSASIPLTLCMAENTAKDNTLLVGFGVGLSWGTVHLNLSKTKMIPVVEV